MVAGGLHRLVGGRLGVTVLPTDLAEDSEMAKGIDRCDGGMLVCGDSSGRRHDHPVKADSSAATPTLGAQH